MSTINDEQVRTLGYNSHIEHDARAFHVQTEVLGRAALKVRTMVLEDGVVLLTLTQPIAANDASAILEFVETHHSGVVQRVKAGEVG